MLDGHRIIADPIIYRELDIQAGNTILLSFITEDLNRNKKKTTENRSFQYCRSQYQELGYGCKYLGYPFYTERKLVYLSIFNMGIWRSKF